MQKFTRPLTREIDVAGERLALTFSEQGIVVRPVGSRRPPVEMSWADLIHHVMERDAASPAPDAVSAAVQRLKSGQAVRASSTAPSEPTSDTSAAAPAPSAQRTSQPPAAPAAEHGGGLRALLDRLDAWFRSHRPHFHKELHPGAGPADLEGLQHALGGAVSEELRTLLSWHNGQNRESAPRFEGDWLLMSAAEIAEAVRDLRGDSSSGLQPGWIPFLDDDEGDYLCLDTATTGHPVCAYWAENAAQRKVVSPSLGAWVEDFLGDLGKGLYREDPERGSFLKTVG